MLPNLILFITNFKYMKKFLIRCFLYASPLFIAFLTIYIVDPYYLFTSNEHFDKDKYEIGYSYDQGRRYKIFTYWNNPTDKIILGASEINVISERNIPESGWHSLSYGGSPLQESLKMYWEVRQDHHLSKVIIAPEFIKYYNAISSGNGDPYYANFSWTTSQSKKALDIYHNKFDYFLDKYTMKSTWKCITTSKSDILSKPKTTKKIFWTSQLDYAHQVYEGNTVFPEKIPEILELFQSIKRDADNNNINIIIVIPIQHVDLLKIEFQPHVYNIYKNYIQSLIEIFGNIYYFAYTAGTSENESLFSDPFHYLEPDTYLNNIWGECNPDFVLTNDNFEEKLKNIQLKLLTHE